MLIGSPSLVIARRVRSERRGNPSCLGEGGRLVCSLSGSQWIATGYALAMTRVIRNGSKHNIVIARKE
ncbi:hypothetical protein OAV71_00985 [Opitutales bacterium]|nr:hypothetical protein [Opitutales bacterium]